MPAPDGPQFVTMYHASFKAKPPHDPFVNNVLEDYTNAHPDVIHMGSLTAANSFKRRYIHEYRVPVEHVYPVTFGDEDEFIYNETHRDEQGVPTEFGAVMKGKQPGLFETMAGYPELALKSKMAVPYRNMTREDMGGISYMVPKSLIRRDGAEWVDTIDQHPSLGPPADDDDEDY